MSSSCSSVSDFFRSFVPVREKPIPKRLHAAAVGVGAATFGVLGMLGLVPVGIAACVYIGRVDVWNRNADKLQRASLEQNPIYKKLASKVPGNFQVLKALTKYFESEGFSNFKHISNSSHCVYKAQKGVELVKLKITLPGTDLNQLGQKRRGERACLKYLPAVPELVKRSSLVYLNPTRVGEFVIEEEPDNCQLAVQTFPFVGNMDLLDFLSITPPSVEKFQKSVRCSLKIVDILLLIHARGCAHRDIKCENIAYDPETEEVFFIDQDPLICLEGEELASTPRGTSSYTPPEIDKAIACGYSYRPLDLDRWGFGCILYTLFARREPVGPRMETRWPTLESDMAKAEVPPEFVEELSSLIKGLLAFVPEQRFDLTQAKERLEALAKAAS